MDEHLRQQLDTTLNRLEALVRRGRDLRNTLTVDALRAWQQDCAALVHHLSGGSKAHWLSRAYSSALLVRSEAGAVADADPADIVDRVVGVLVQGATSLTGMDGSAAPSDSAPRPRRFEFVHAERLRPVLEQSFDDSRVALERGEFGRALVLSCGMIDAVLTDALEHARTPDHNAPAEARGPARRAGPQTRTGKPALSGRVAQRPDLGEGGSFETRIAEAEQAGLIRGGCARLPPVARQYRDLTDADGEVRAGVAVSEREARVAGQVLRVVMRDLDPGR